MIIRAAFTPDGFPAGFFPEDIWPEGFPDDAVEITESQWREFLENPGARKWAGGEVVEFDPPQPPEPVPVVSRRQFFQQAATAGDISPAEALAAVQTNAIPATMQAFIDALPLGDQFGAQMLIAGASEFDPAHPLSTGYAMATGKTPEEKDQFFRDAANL